MVVVLLNVGVNVLQGSLFGVSGRFPPLYAGAVMIGQAMGGVVPSLAAIALITFDVQPPILGNVFISFFREAFIIIMQLGPACFGAIIVLLVIAIWTFHVMKTCKFFLFYAEGKNDYHENNLDNAADDLINVDYRTILQRSWPYLLSGLLNYATTLMIFPALTSTGTC